MKFDLHIHGPLRVKCNSCDDPLDFDSTNILFFYHYYLITAKDKITMSVYGPWLLKNVGHSPASHSCKYDCRLLILLHVWFTTLHTTYPEKKLLNLSESEVAMTMEDYIMLADIPKIQLESEEEFPGLRKRNQSPSPCRDHRLRTYRPVAAHRTISSSTHV